MKILLAMLIMICLFLGLSGLIYWGIGSLVVYVFGLSCTWTYLHGLACALLVGTLRSIFKK